MSFDDFDIVEFSELEETPDAQREEEIRKLTAEVERLRLESANNAEVIPLFRTQRLHLENLTLENARDRFPTVAAFKRALSGTWSIIDSYNVEEYSRAQGAENAYDMKFQLSDVTLNLDREGYDFLVPSRYVVTNYRVHRKRYQLQGFELSTLVSHRNSTHIYRIADNCLLTFITRTDSTDEELEKRFLIHEMLHVVLKRNGVECTKIYTKNRGEVEVRCGEHIPALEARKARLEREMLEMDRDPMFIKNRIVGKWANAEQPETNVSFYYDRDCLKWFWEPRRVEYSETKLSFVIEENRIVFKCDVFFDCYELSMDGDNLVVFDLKQNRRSVYTRVGDPEGPVFR